MSEVTLLHNSPCVLIAQYPHTMQMGRKSRIIFCCVLGALICAPLFVFTRRSQIRPRSESALGPPTVTASRVSPTSPSQIRSFEERLEELPATDWKNTVDRGKRAAIIIEWLAADRAAAMRFLSQSHYKDLWLPGVTKTIGEKATPSELLDIANRSEQPGEAVYQVARWDSPSAINELAGLMPSVSITAAGPTAGAIGSLLAGINVDRAMAFAMGQATDQLRSSAIAGVMNELVSLPNGDAEIRAWYSLLPPAIQGTDQVLASYGNAIWSTDPAAALQTLQGIGDHQTKVIACLVLARNSASSSPETAIAAVYESGLSDVGIYNHVNQILQNWYAVNPQAAANFLSTTQIIPPSDLSKYAPITSAAGGGKG
jgi:hypothetical protein